MLRRTGLALVGVLAVLSCTQDTPTAVRAGGEARVISDGSDSSGNAHFFFLPPMVPPANFAGVFDPSLSPVVEVCEWTAGCGRVVARFTTAGTGSAAIRTDTAGQDYIVNWDTQQCIWGSCTLSTTITYRLRVMVATVLLGFADVQLVSNGSQLRNVNSSQYISLVDGRTLPMKFRIEVGAINVVPSTGGSTVINPSQGATIATAGGEAVLTIPPGALPGGPTATISLTPKSTSASATGPTPLTGTAWDFGPDGTQFRVPITVKMSYDTSRIPRGVPQADLRLFRLDAGSSSWLLLPGGRVDPATHTVSAPITQFSDPAVGPLPAPDGFIWDFNLSGSPVQGSLLVWQLGDPTFAGGRFLTVTAYSQADPDYLQCDRQPVYTVANSQIVSLDSTTTVTDYESYVANCLGLADFPTTTVQLAWVRPMAVGTTYLRANLDGYLDSLMLEVVRPHVGSVLPAITSLRVNVGQTMQDSALAFTEWGAPLADSAVSWTSDDTTIAAATPTSSHSVVIRGVKQGHTILHAVAGAARADVSVDVIQPGAIVSVRMLSASLFLNPGQTVRDSALALDGWGAPLADSLITWTADNTAIVSLSTDSPHTVDVRGGNVGCTTIHATAGSIRNDISVMVVAQPALADGIWDFTSDFLGQMTNYLTAACPPISSFHGWTIGSYQNGGFVPDDGIVNSGGGLYTWVVSAAPLTGNTTVNTSGNSVSAYTAVWQAGQSTFHPGLNPSQGADVRWTSPISGAVTVTAAFTGVSTQAGQGTTVNVHVALRGSEIWVSPISGSVVLGSGSTPQATFSQVIQVSQGDVLDFWLDDAGQYLSDQTGVSIRITTGP